MKDLSLIEKLVAQVRLCFPEVLRQADASCAPMQKSEWPLEVILPMHLIGGMRCGLGATASPDFEQPVEPDKVGAAELCLPGQDLVNFDHDAYAPPVSTPVNGNIPSNASVNPSAWDACGGSPCLRAIGEIAEGLMARHGISNGGQSGRLLFSPGSDMEFEFVPLPENRRMEKFFNKAIQKTGSIFSRCGGRIHEALANKTRGGLICALNPLFHVCQSCQNGKDLLSGQFHIRLQEVLWLAGGFFRQASRACFYSVKTFACEYGFSAMLKMAAEYMQGHILAARAGSFPGQGDEREKKKCFLPRFGCLPFPADRALMEQAQSGKTPVIKFNWRALEAAGAMVVRGGFERLRSLKDAGEYGQA